MTQGKMTDGEIEELIKVASAFGTRTYVEIVPSILTELLRLRRKLRELEIEQATRSAANV